MSLSAPCQILGQAQSYIDFLVLHTYPFQSQNYGDYAAANENFQARQGSELPCAIYVHPNMLYLTRLAEL